MERGAAVAAAIDSNAVAGQIDKYHAAFRCYKVLGLKCIANKQKYDYEVTG
jgi:hypothetical protein